MHVFFSKTLGNSAPLLPRTIVEKLPLPILYPYFGVAAVFFSKSYI